MIISRPRVNSNQRKLHFRVVLEQEHRMMQSVAPLIKRTRENKLYRFGTRMVNSFGRLDF